MRHSEPTPYSAALLTQPCFPILGRGASVSNKNRSIRNLDTYRTKAGKRKLSRRLFSPASAQNCSNPCLINFLTD